eukprot:NODE_303_length_11391_cov_0.177028.p6 type:complete len:109 gc:universal NODE_303_length_11391_cov_0.177028:5549-5223(-)
MSFTMIINKRFVNLFYCVSVVVAGLNYWDAVNKLHWVAVPCRICSGVPKSVSHCAMPYVEQYGCHNVQQLVSQHYVLMVAVIYKGTNKPYDWEIDQVMFILVFGLDIM